MEMEHEVCEECGSKSFYREESTDRLVCEECNTEKAFSQRVVDNTNDDYATGAKHFGFRKYNNSRYSSIRNLKSGRFRYRSGEELDSSQPLPSVLECCDAFQVLLKKAAECASRLTGLDDLMSEVGPTHIFDKRFSENKAGGECNSDVNAKHLEGKGTNALVSLVGEMWFKYLRAWKEGADKYGSIYPELRFSLHDAFLTNPLKGMVKRFLLAKALQKLQEEDDDDRDDDITKPIKKN